MSHDLDPQWQSDPTDRPVRVTVRESAAPAAAQKTISRRPAAVAGVLVVMGMVLSVYGGADLFPAQTGTTLVDTKKNVIVITDAGFNPSTLTVSQGDTITWENKAAIPHILSSDTLATTDGLLTTPVIFTGSTLSVTLTKDAKVGPHAYISMTSTLSGSIIVKAAVAEKSSVSSAKKSDAVSSLSSSAGISSTAPIAVVPSSSSSVAAVVATSVSSAQPILPPAPMGTQAPPSPLPGQMIGSGPQVPVIPTTPVGAIPRNPYAQQNVAAPVVGSQALSSLHAGAPLKSSRPAVTKHKPTSQPGSGPAETGILVAISLVALLIVSRKALSRGAMTIG